MLKLEMKPKPLISVEQLKVLGRNKKPIRKKVMKKTKKKVMKKPKKKVMKKDRY